jgi:steroid delta-isomerase-like uncharacterized protein
MVDVKQLVRGFIEAVWNEGRLDRIEEFVDPGFLDHESTFPFSVRGREGVQRVLVFFRTAFPDVHWNVEDVVAEGPKVVVRFTARGTHRGSIVGFPGTGRRITVTGLVIFRIESGRIAESWTHWDTLGLLQQLGVADPIDFRPAIQPT